MSKLSPLNVIFWNGKDVGTKNTRFSVVIDEMLEHCFNTNFSSIFDSGISSQCDLIILGEIYPTPPYEKHYSLIQQEGDVGGKFRGRIVSLGGTPLIVGDQQVHEHFLVAYNTRTIAKVELQLIAPTFSSQKSLLEVAVRTKKFDEWAHKIIAVHLENNPTKQRDAIDLALQQFKTSTRNKGKFPHLLLGDTNNTEESVKKANDENGNALVLPSLLQEIVFRNPELGPTRKSGYRTGLPVDRAWVNTGLSNAMGAYISGSQRKFKFSDAIYKDLKDKTKSENLSIGVSDHSPMAVVLKAN